MGEKLSDKALTTDEPTGMSLWINDDGLVTKRQAYEVFKAWVLTGEVEFIHPTTEMTISNKTLDLGGGNLVPISELKYESGGYTYRNSISDGSGVGGSIETSLSVTDSSGSGFSMKATNGKAQMVQLNAGSTVVSIELEGGNISMVGLPTSSAGLPTFALWNDSGTIKIV